MKLLKRSDWFEVIVVLYSLISLIKLDFNYFFTDEILYTQTGIEALIGNFSDNLQVPFIAKFLAGLTFTVFGPNVFWLRSAFVLCFILANIFLYKFLKKIFQQKIALISSIFYISTISVFEANRMVMLESPMHLFWILFLYFYYDTHIKNRKKDYVISGIFLGLSLATKFTSITLILFTFLGFIYSVFLKKNNLAKTIQSYISMYLSGVGVLFLSYLPYFNNLGIKPGIKSILSDFADTYLQRNKEGKSHVINDQVFNRSPFWSYLYYSYAQDGVLKTLSSFFALFSIFKIEFNTLFFGTFFILNFILFLGLTLHNSRYLSSLYIPLIFLITIGVNNLESKYKFFKNTLIIIASISVVVHLKYLYDLSPTRYLNLYNYLKFETNNFNSSDRVYAYGSVRTLNWYRNEISNPNQFLIRRDYEIMCPEFYTFNIFVFDKEELQKINFKGNAMFDYIQSNIPSFQKLDALKDFILFKRISKNEEPFVCPTKPKTNSEDN